MVLHAVLDTNVIFEGLTKQGGVCGLIIDAWQAGLITVCVSNTLLHEYNDVFGRKLSPQRFAIVVTLLEQLLNQWTLFTVIDYSWRPMSPDPGDDHVIDCAMNAHAVVVTSNVRDFRRAREELGLRVVTPIELLKFLSDG
jgi:putative PIN family toxin of toxin-antitoxin system